MTALDEFPADRIQDAHQRGATLIRNARPPRATRPSEPLPVALAVERHRWAWRPSIVNVALIAESHVYTTEQDLAITIRPDRLPEVARQAPAEYVRLVYCLGYGEGEVLSGAPAVENRGTPDFWRMFGRLAGMAPLPSGTTLDDRLRWKVQTLLSLQAKGVWLLDAALHGFYAPGGERVVSPALGAELHAVWWRGYGLWILDQLPPTARVWAVGKGVHDALAERVTFDGYIYQPRAARNRSLNMEHGWDRLLADVARGFEQ